MFSRLAILPSNQIYLQVRSKNLLCALKKSKDAEIIKIKLEKRGSVPLLRFTLKIFSRQQKMIVFHEVPVRICSDETEILELQSPSLTDPDIQLCAPPMNKQFKLVVDKMIHFGKYVTLEAYPSGELNLCVTTSELKLRVIYKHLKSPDATTPLHKAKVVLKSKMLTMITRCRIIDPVNVVFHIFDEKMLVVSVFTQQM